MNTVRLLAAIAAAVLATSAIAQVYPSKPIQILVGYASGGTGDMFARLIAEALSGTLGQQVVVQNRPGGSGGIATQFVTKAAPDGHTLLLGQTGEVAIAKNFVRNLAYDPDKELVPVALVGVVPLALVSRADAPYHNLQSMTDYARAQASGLSFASAGTGTPGHFAGELLKAKLKGNFIHVPYKGAAPALTDLLGGNVGFFFSGMPAAMPHILAGRVRLLAVSTLRRAPVAPGTPTVAEKLPGFDFSLWGGVFAPSGTPLEIIARLNREINEILAQPDTRARLAREGAEVAPLSPAEFAEFVRSESAKFERVIRETGIRSE